MCTSPGGVICFSFVMVALGGAGGVSPEDVVATLSDGRSWMQKLWTIEILWMVCCGNIYAQARSREDLNQVKVAVWS